MLLLLFVGMVVAFPTNRQARPTRKTASLSLSHCGFTSARFGSETRQTTGCNDTKQVNVRYGCYWFRLTSCYIVVDALK